MLASTSVDSVSEAQRKVVVAAAAVVEVPLMVSLAPRLLRGQLPEQRGSAAAGECL